MVVKTTVIIINSNNNNNSVYIRIPHGIRNSNAKRKSFLLNFILFLLHFFHIFILYWQLFLLLFFFDHLHLCWFKHPSSRTDCSVLTSIWCDNMKKHIPQFAFFLFSLSASLSLIHSLVRTAVEYLFLRLMKDGHWDNKTQGKDREDVLTQKGIKDHPQNTVITMIVSFDSFLLFIDIWFVSHHERARRTRFS